MAWGGRYKFNAMSHPSSGEGWVSFRRRPPKEAIVALVERDIVENECFIQLSIAK